MHTDLNCNIFMSLQVKAGEKCQRLIAEKLVDLPMRDVEVYEIWDYVLKKENHNTACEQDFAEIGDTYRFVAMERNAKLVLTHYLGKRTAPAKEHFIAKLADAPGIDRSYIGHVEKGKKKVCLRTMEVLAMDSASQSWCPSFEGWG
jgi:hypothetical protein